VAIIQNIVPIHRIETNEYECRICGYRWTNRKNGKDGGIPQKCAKCKKEAWNRPYVSAREMGLRRRVSYLSKIYEFCIDKEYLQWPREITQEFLDLQPRPTMEELWRVIEASNLNLNSQTQYRSKFRSLPKSFLRKEAQKHINTMQQIIDYKKMHE
jgi:hypothetical protein